MPNHLKFVSKVPWITRYTWIAIMLLASMFASQWGVANEQIKILLMINGVYVLAVALPHAYYRRMTETKLFLGFLCDLVIWSAFIYYSGGASNPLITLFLTIVAVASIVLNTYYIIGLSILSVISYFTLWHFYVPLMVHHNHQIAEKFHLLGMFGVFVFSLMMLTALTVYFKSAMNRSYQALEQAQQAIHQQRRLLAVSSFAANIAHEMSTPIASMQLLTEDMADQLDDEDELLEDIQLLQSQILVCRQSLDTLKTHIQINDAKYQQQLPNSVKHTRLEQFFPKLIAEWRFLNPHIHVEMTAITVPICVYINAEQLYSIMVNIFNNAVQAGATQLLIQLQTAEQTTIKIIDNGRGIDPEKLAKINQQQPIISGTGWGVGIMLAKTVLDYVGGELTIDPNYHDQQIAGTQVAIQLNHCYHEPQQESE